MAEMGHFTLPVGQDPDRITPAEFCFTRLFPEKLEEMFLLQDEDGPYTLYSGVYDEGAIYNIVPIFRVRKPLLSAAPAVYLDTSAISYINQSDSPEKTDATLKFWEAAKAGCFFLYLSDVTLEELLRCPEPKRSAMFDLLGEVRYTTIETSQCPPITTLIQDIAKMGILPKKSEADVVHIAAALHARCNVIASWNFKHLVNPATVTGVRTVAMANRCGSIDILSPKSILEVYL